MTLFGENFVWTFDEAEQLHATPCESEASLGDLPKIKLNFGKLTADFEPAAYGWYANGKCYVNFEREETILTWTIGENFFRGKTVRFD